MRYPAYFLLVAPLFLLACGNSDQEPTAAQGDDPYNALAARVSAITGKTGPVRDGQAGQDSTEEIMATSTEGLRDYTVYSATYKVPMSHIQLPAHWKVSGLETGYWSATAPGLRVTPVKPVNFKNVTGPMREMLINAGERMRAPLSPEQVVQQDIAPRMQAEGYELVDQKRRPDLSRKAMAEATKFYVSQQIHFDMQTLQTVWRKGDQRRAFFLNWMQMDGNAMTTWNYSGTILDAPASSFETELNSLVQAELTARMAPEVITAQRRDVQMKEQQAQVQAQQQQLQGQQSWAAHNQRMQQRWSAFNATQAAHNDMVNSVNNSIMGTYNSTSASMDRMQNATINGIRGEQDAYNPYTGQTGKIESGYNNYWMNSDGQYFGTNDVMHDPNVNGDWTDQWRQVPTEP